MIVALTYGHTYRARVAIDDALIAIITPDSLRGILARYQLFGRVNPVRGGYSVVAEYRGKTGTYDLPSQVTSVELVK